MSSKSKVSITALILTYNEEQHLERCLRSLIGICEDIVIVDSFSTDQTLKIASENHVRVFQNKWVNYANQFNWGLEETNISSDWVLRIDADEYLSSELQRDIIEKLPNLTEEVSGIFFNRIMYFQNKPLKKGGMYPIKHIKMWRNGYAYCEQRWMDERMKLIKGNTVTFQGDLIDHNLNNLSWWTQKHNNYATREAIDILNGIYNFTETAAVKPSLFGNSEERRRWFKKRYLKLPLFVRPVLFWIVRYFFQGAFLEGKNGLIWTTLQCGWYRFLVDAKIFEAYRIAGKNKEDLIRYFRQEYGYDITKI
ncbi:MAG: glycosyltransferase family 2 protein [Christiangramia sp.]|nr:glycosyltransferase family 2 protein [Christiangramia sp.]